MMTGSVIANVGNVVNQSEGFVVKITINNPFAIPLKDGKLIVANFPSAWMEVGVGKDIEILIPTIVANGDYTIDVVFETKDNIPDGMYNLDFKFGAFIGINEWLVIIPDTVATRNIAIQHDPAKGDPYWVDELTKQVQIIRA